MLSFSQLLFTVTLRWTNAIAGHLWTTGFRNGDLKTPLFDDVVPTLEAWKTVGKTLAIFSSGSVQAQIQFFSYVKDGSSTRDIKPLFSAHYDTVNAGPKLEKASYEKICAELGKDVSKVTFLTDNVKGMLAATPYLKQHTIALTALRNPTTPLYQTSIYQNTPPCPDFRCPVKPIFGCVTRFISDCWHVGIP